MLLFIGLLFCETCGKASFNTSHVVVYRLACIYSKLRCERFNTSHVVVYPFVFVWISLIFLIFITSHVVVYRVGIEMALGRPVFQYISCCCLSTCYCANEAIETMFQYISCCCLSFSDGETVHVTDEFQYISCCCLSRNDGKNRQCCCSFNTSHVVVYPAHGSGKLMGLIVSIHLMLLFIPRFLAIFPFHYL